MPKEKITDHNHYIDVFKDNDSGLHIVNLHCTLIGSYKHLGSFPDSTFAFDFAETTADRLSIKWASNLKKDQG